MNSWFNSVDIYCERLDASFWAEPINAMSNLSFIVAGFFLWRLRSSRSKLMAILIIFIGLGSFSFHTFANRLTGLIDVLAIALYLVTFAFLIPKQWSRNSMLIQSGSVILLILSIVLAQLLITYLNPALPWLPPGMYLGAWLALIMYALATQYSNLSAARFLWMAVIVFPASLLSRQIDMSLCDSIGGSHWLWHLLNGLTLYLSSYGLCLKRSKLQ
ncbi:ceramidase domain-containing protein [Polynucleobacter sp. MG-Unter2-18]|uniref:ceramidase domain-containing protein n=1 Tax=Polynucleobacter sp. MG-Unter2-18 TaxID=2081052 RepID=UPI001BFDD4C2|nr:ceramidase domain-containing protein [Polynucleobacter sp. MG-Unter2-18]QWD95371.1 ceramidase domain-containing protein [Polynucleobacter sp. MG-Unter2-18]